MDNGVEFIRIIKENDLDYKKEFKVLVYMMDE